MADLVAKLGNCRGILSLAFCVKLRWLDFSTPVSKVGKTTRRIFTAEAKVWLLLGL